jgi:hypothetical protein
LTRYIPEKVRSKIRQDSGFGCVFCGCLFVDYEHIEPEFSDAKEHCSSKMTLLCIDCHARVTRGLISKRSVWEAKSNPKALQDGFAHDVLNFNTNKMEFNIGNTSAISCQIILTIRDKPIIWFESPTFTNEPSKLCAIFHNEDSKASAYINRNNFNASTNNLDVQSKSTTLQISYNNKISLKIDRKADSVLKILQMSSEYLGISVNINPNGDLIVKNGSSTFTFSGNTISNCGSAIGLGSLPISNKYNKLFLAISIAKRPTKIYSLNPSIYGWIINDQIFNSQYQLVAYLIDTSVYNINFEFIGYYSDGYITHRDDFYVTGEPIFISSMNRNIKNVSILNGYDLSSRVLGLFR